MWYSVWHDIPVNVSWGNWVRPLNERSSVLRFNFARSGDLMMTFFGLLSSGDPFLADKRRDCIDDTDFVDLADVIDFFPWLTALFPDFLSETYNKVSCYF